MTNSLINFDNLKQNEEGRVFWSARELQKVFGYERWENFEALINRAKVSFETSKSTKEYDINYHFRKVTKMIGIGKGGKRELPDYRLSKYACYLVAQNGDPSKAPIAQAQAYFNVQTLRQEQFYSLESDIQRLERRKEFSESDKKLSGDIIETGVSPRGLASIKASGNKVYFGGKTSKEMQERLGTGSRPWADKASNVVLAGKTFANELTSASIRYNGVSTAPEITKVNDSNNQAVRDTIYNQQGVFPEDFPPEEDIKKIERRVSRASRDVESLGE